MLGEDAPQRDGSAWFPTPGWVELAPGSVQRTDVQVAIDALVVCGGEAPLTVVRSAAGHSWFLEAALS